MLVRGVSPREVFTQYMARGGSPTGGKDCNLHFGDLKRGLISPISMLGALIPVMAGVALAAKLQRRRYVAMTYIGDGGTSTGDFHEGMNLAAVLEVPLVVVAEHNGYAYSTPTARQMKIKDLAQRAAGLRHPGAHRRRQRRARGLRGGARDDRSGARRRRTADSSKSRPSA